jgi:mycofactocin system creatininase family protein
VELGGATWPEIAATQGACLLAVPIGSLEQHGPHLPLDTDTRIAVELATRLTRARPDVVVAPAVAYGASGEHAAFPGTLLINHVVLADLLLELVRSARDSFALVVLISAHGGNSEGLALLSARCRADGDPVLVWSAGVRGGDAHAGRTETSLMLAIDPGAVRMELAVAGATEPLEALLPRLRAEGVRPISSNGVLGDPQGASAAEGESMLVAMTTGLTDAIEARWPEHEVGT